MPELLPKITVVTLVYNTGQFVIRGLESVLEQNYPMELIQHIIIDDHSSDNSVEIIENWIDQNSYQCTFIKRDVNKGICAGLNEALSMAEGKYFIGLPDDYWKPDKLKKEIEIFESLEDDYAVLYTNVDFCNENDEVYEENVIHGDSGVEGDVFVHLLRTKTFIFGPAAMYKAEALRRIGGYDASLRFEDYDMLLRLASEYKFKYVNHSLTVYRHYTSRTSMANSIKKNASDQLEFIKTLVKFLGKSKRTDQIILSKIYKRMSVYEIKNSESPFSLDDLVAEPDMNDRELLKAYKKERLFFQYVRLIGGMRRYPANTRISRRDYFYLLRNYFFGS